MLAISASTAASFEDPVAASLLLTLESSDDTCSTTAKVSSDDWPSFATVLDECRVRQGGRKKHVSVQLPTSVLFGVYRQGPSLWVHVLTHEERKVSERKNAHTE